MLTKKELTGDREFPLVTGKEFMMLFKTWNCVARSPPEVDESSEDPDQPDYVSLS